MATHDLVGAETACPDESALLALADGTLTPSKHASVQVHIDVCRDCHEALGWFARADADPSSRTAPDDPRDARLDESSLTVGDRLGRYCVRTCIGRGSGGTVYAADDPELGRVVALKVLHGSGDLDTISRWRREASAMARISHPNVVPIFELAIERERVFIASEYVDGPSLERWLKHDLRGTAAILAVFLDAARGLAAIHDAGFVHRDFKPHNVVIGGDGRARVTDFGLVRLLESRQASTRTTEEVSPASSDLVHHRTRTGTLVGTPAYMSPEQFEGADVDGRSDQFSFCVALFEALWGVRPFAGETLEALAAAVRAGQLVRPAHRRGLPAWLVRLVRRGLSADPRQRFPDMHALVAALEAGPRKRRRQQAVIATTFLSLGMGAVLHLFAPRLLQPCRDGGDAFAAVWSDESSATVQASLAEGGAAHARDVATAVARHLDRYAQQWIEVRQSVCEATRIHGVNTERQLELQMRCLDGQKNAFGAVANMLRDPSTLNAALDLVDGLHPPSTCSDVAALEQRDALWRDPAAAEAMEGIRGPLADAELNRLAGRFEQAKALAEAAVARAEQSQVHAVRAAALLELGMVLKKLHHGATEKTLRDAVWAAEASGHVEVAAEGWMQLIEVVGISDERLADGEAAAERADAAVHRAGAPYLQHSLASNRAVLASRAGRYEEALDQHRKALALAQDLYGSEHRLVAAAHVNIAAVLKHLGRLEEAQASAELAVAVFERASGAAHPDTATALSALAVVRGIRGEEDEAIAILQRVASLREAAYGATHPLVATTRMNLGMMLAKAKRHEEATPQLERALELQRSLHGESHPSVAQTLHNLARVLEDTGDHARAVELYEQSLPAWVAAKGEQHPETGNVYHAFGRALFVVGRNEESVVFLRKALTIRQRTNADAYFHAATMMLLARSLAAVGEVREARALAEAGIALAQTMGERGRELREPVEAWLKDGMRRPLVVAPT